MSEELDLVKECNSRLRGLVIRVIATTLESPPYLACCNFDEAIGRGSTPQEALNRLFEELDLCKND